MGRLIIMVLAGAGLFFAGAWSLGLFEDPGSPFNALVSKNTEKVPTKEQLGGELYSAKPFPTVGNPPLRSIDPIVLHGNMNALEEEEVPSQVNGRVLFIGEELDEDVAPLAGSAALLAEPYYFATIQAGRQTFVKFYRRLYA